jgi:hypothetical protein
MRSSIPSPRVSTEAAATENPWLTVMDGRSMGRAMEFDKAPFKVPAAPCYDDMMRLDISSAQP